jgi:hypothetical protein
VLWRKIFVKLGKLQFWCTSSIAVLSNLNSSRFGASNPAIHLILSASSLAEKRREKLLF